MSHFTHTRTEWAAIAATLATAEPADIPPGLAQRIAALLRATPSAWPDEPCTLELEPASAAAVSLLLAQGRGVTGAEQIVQTHQRGNAMAGFRIEHRTGGVNSVVAYLTDVPSLSQEFMRHGTRLRAAFATGELVLVEQGSQNELAYLALLPEPGTGQRPSQAS